MPDHNGEARHESVSDDDLRGSSRSQARLTPEQALAALNELRSNMVATQHASWSNTVYPLVAILNAAGLRPVEPTVRQQAEHLDCYGGAGGYPGHLQKEPNWQAEVDADRLNRERLALREKGIDPFNDDESPAADLDPGRGE